MSVLASDDFAGTGALSGNWSTVTGLNTLEREGGQATNSSAGVCGMRYTGVSSPDNQYAKVTLSELTAHSDTGPGPAVRWASGAETGYFAQANTVETRLYKVVAASFTQLGSDGAACAVNDTLELRVNGSSLTVFKNGSSIITASDGSIASGAFGMWCAGGAAPLDGGMADWEGGDVEISGIAHALADRPAGRPRPFAPGHGR